MKKFLFVSFIACGLLSCGPNKPDNTIYGTQITADGYQPDPRGAGYPPVQVADTFYKLKPTWGQAGAFAKMRGDHGVWTIIGIVLFLLLGAFCYGQITDARWMPNLNPKAIGVILFILVAGAIASLRWQAMDIKWNNDHLIPKQQYDNAIRESGSTAPIWDSLAKGCHLTGGPYDCYK